MSDYDVSTQPSCLWAMKLDQKYLFDNKNQPTARTAHGEAGSAGCWEGREHGENIMVPSRDVHAKILTQSVAAWTAWRLSLRLHPFVGVRLKRDRVFVGTWPVVQSNHQFPARNWFVEDNLQRDIFADGSLICYAGSKCSWMPQLSLVLPQRSTQLHRTLPASVRTAECCAWEMTRREGHPGSAGHQKEGGVHGCEAEFDRHSRQQHPWSSFSDQERDRQ